MISKGFFLALAAVGTAVVLLCMVVFLHFFVTRSTTFQCHVVPHSEFVYCKAIHNLRLP